MLDLKRLIAEREAHLAAWARIIEPETREIDVDEEIVKLYGELWETYRKLSKGKRERIRVAIRQRSWPADFALGWYQRGHVRSDTL